MIIMSLFLFETIGTGYLGASQTGEPKKPSVMRRAAAKAAGAAAAVPGAAVGAVKKMPGEAAEGAVGYGFAGMAAGNKLGKPGLVAGGVGGFVVGGVAGAGKGLYKGAKKGGQEAYRKTKERVQGKKKSNVYN